MTAEADKINRLIHEGEQKARYTNRPVHLVVCDKSRDLFLTQAPSEQHRVLEVIRPI